MALAKDSLCSVQTCPYSEDLDTLYGFEQHGYYKQAIEEGNLTRFKDGQDGLINMRSSSSPHGSSSSANSSEFWFQAIPNQAKEAHPQMNYKATGHGGHCSLINGSNGSILSLQPGDQTRIGEDCINWDGSPSYCQLWNQMSHKASNSEVRLFKKLNSFQTASNFSSQLAYINKDKFVNRMYSEATIVADAHRGNLQKRSNPGESVQAAKKQCNSPSSSKKLKPKTTSASKDPQSIAAKQRRERISERLRILQELVPNGSKVDLITMLEKAISYVKFLQLQVKVLATDEFWPAQGGKAPDISQVKEAIDAILSSKRDI